MKVKDQFKDAWYYIYGGGSHLNLAGKIFIGVPLFPIVAVMVIVWIFLDLAFAKKEKQ